MEQQATANGKTIVRRSEEEILRHLDEQEKSDLTVKEYCDLFDIVEQTFYSWLKRYRSSKGVLSDKPEEPVAGFTQIEVVPVFNQSRPPLFAEIGNLKLYKEVSAEFMLWK